MRFLLLSKADLFGNAILNRLVPALCPDHEVAICLSDRIFQNERGFSATDEFMYYTRDLVIEQLFPAIDRQTMPGKGEQLTFAGLGKRFGVGITQLGGGIESGTEMIRKEAARFQPEVILCCRHDFIVPESVFSKARLGAYNTHSGAVPSYRGPFCSFWSMANREKYAGCSLHTLKEKVDKGDIIGTAWQEIDYSKTLVHNLLQIYFAGNDLFLDLVPRLAEGPLPGLPQPRQSGRYYRQPEAEDYDDFTASGARLVDAEHCRTIYERYLPPGVKLDELVPDWEWSGA